jgi:hypothetical protein
MSNHIGEVDSTNVRDVLAGRAAFLQPLPTEPPRAKYPWLFLVKRVGKSSVLHAGSGAILFHERDPLAVSHGGVVYFCEAKLLPAVSRLVNEFEPTAPHCRIAQSEFLFMLGAVLTTAGLPLTHSPAQP